MARAQIEIMNLAIATAVMVLISSIGLMWYGTNSFNRSYIAEDTAFIASNMPEIQCSYRGTTKTGCIDLLRASQVDDEYYGSFGYSTISIYYVEEGQEKNSTIYDRKMEFRKREISEFPVSVYDASTGSYYAGKIRAEAYS
jgi:hypothetical protein